MDSHISRNPSLSTNFDASGEKMSLSSNVGQMGGRDIHASNERTGLQMGAHPEHSLEKQSLLSRQAGASEGEKRWDLASALSELSQKAAIPSSSEKEALEKKHLEELSSAIHDSEGLVSPEKATELLKSIQLALSELLAKGDHSNKEASAADLLKASFLFKSIEFIQKSINTSISRPDLMILGDLDSKKLHPLVPIAKSIQAAAESLQRFRDQGTQVSSYEAAQAVDNLKKSIVAQKETLVHLATKGEDRQTAEQLLHKLENSLSDITSRMRACEKLRTTEELEGLAYLEQLNNLSEEIDKLKENIIDLNGHFSSFVDLIGKNKSEQLSVAKLALHVVGYAIALAIGTAAQVAALVAVSLLAAPALPIALTIGIISTIAYTTFILGASYTLVNSIDKLKKEEKDVADDFNKIKKAITLLDYQLKEANNISSAAPNSTSSFRLSSSVLEGKISNLDHSDFTVSKEEKRPLAFFLSHSGFNEWLANIQKDPRAQPNATGKAGLLKELGQNLADAFSDNQALKEKMLSKLQQSILENNIIDVCEERGVRLSQDQKDNLEALQKDPNRSIKYILSNLPENQLNSIFFQFISIAAAEELAESEMDFNFSHLTEQVFRSASQDNTPETQNYFIENNFLEVLVDQMTKAFLQEQGL